MGGERLYHLRCGPCFEPRTARHDFGPRHTLNGNIAEGPECARLNACHSHSGSADRPGILQAAYYVRCSPGGSNTYKSIILAKRRR